METQLMMSNILPLNELSSGTSRHNNRRPLPPAWAQPWQAGCGRRGSRAGGCPHTAPGCEGLGWPASGSRWERTPAGPSTLAGTAAGSWDGLAPSNTTPRRDPSCAACAGHFAACSNLKNNEQRKREDSPASNVLFFDQPCGVSNFTLQQIWKQG